MSNLIVDVELGGAVRRLALDGNATIAFIDAWQLDLHDEIRKLFLDARDAAEAAEDAREEADQAAREGKAVPDPEKSYSLAVLSTGANMRRLRRIVWGLAVSYRPDLEADPVGGVAEVGRWFALSDMTVLCKAIMDCWLANKPLAPEFSGQLAPFVPTPEPVVEAMLDLAELQPGQVVVDLGAGDGRLMMRAVDRAADVRAYGYELHEERYRELAVRVAAHPAGQRLGVFREDIRKAYLANADVVFMYLLQESNAALKEKLLSEMKPGAIVVSHAFDMPDWLPEKTEALRAVSSMTGKRTTHRLYRWRIPARG